jgi:hypothetical protein
MEDIPGQSRRGKGRYNRDQRVLMSMLMVFGLILFAGLLLWLL